MRLPLSTDTVLGRDPLVREQVSGVLFSASTYAFYGLITAVQVGYGLLDARLAWALMIVGIGTNVVFYAIVRRGWVREGRDPGLRATQLVFGVVLMWAAYAALGAAVSSLLIVVASHVVYSMFVLTPRGVWRLVLFSLGGLAATMLACNAIAPARFPPALQVSAFLYVALVVPLIALLAHRVTAMTQRLRDLATRDELTRVHNRRHLAELMAAQLAQHRRTGAPLSLALLDIDHFKQVNDRLGHAAGDEVLKRFAALAGGRLRTTDVLGRWGGEEFLVLMPSTSRDAALVAMERLQAALRLASPEVMPERLAVSFSAGVVQIGADETLDRAVERADAAMYRAKAAGRARAEAG